MSDYAARFNIATAVFRHGQIYAQAALAAEIMAMPRPEARTAREVREIESRESAARLLEKVAAIQDLEAQWSEARKGASGAYGKIREALGVAAPRDAFAAHDMAKTARAAATSGKRIRAAAHSLNQLLAGANGKDALLEVVRLIEGVAQARDDHYDVERSAVAFAIRGELADLRGALEVRPRRREKTEHQRRIDKARRAVTKKLGNIFRQPSLTDLWGGPDSLGGSVMDVIPGRSGDIVSLFDQAASGMQSAKDLQLAVSCLGKGLERACSAPLCEISGLQSYGGSTLHQAYPDLGHWLTAPRQAVAATARAEMDLV